MIVSTKNKFIFVHNPKTAGNSISFALSKYDNIRLSWGLGKHETINEFAKRTELVLDDFFVFGFVRHPLDRFASLFHYIKRRWRHKYPQINNLDTVNDMAKCLNDPWVKGLYGYKPQHVFFNDRTFVGRYENLYDDLLEIESNIGVPLKLVSNKMRNYDSQYTTDGRELVLNHYAEDLSLYGYT